MENVMNVSEQLLYSTVRIECTTNEGLSTGTGFYYRFELGTDRYVPVVVTNKHVVNGGINGKFIITLADDEGNPMDTNHHIVEFSDFQQRWIYHPEDMVDLCIMPIAPIVHEVRQTGKDLFYRTLEESFIPTYEQLMELNAVEDILMIGYPNGIWDSVNNLPILRKGITATNPKVDYNGKEEIMIDAACFPGSSGSPVLIYNNGMYSNGGTIRVGQERLFLLGVLYAGPQFTATGEIEVVNIPANYREVALSRTRIPNNLGLVIRSSKLLDFKSILQRMVSGQNS